MASIIKVDTIQTAAGGTPTAADLGITVTEGVKSADLYRLNANQSVSSQQVITTNWERADDPTSGFIGTGVSHSSGEFSFPSTGVWLIYGQLFFEIAQGEDRVGHLIRASTDGGTGYDTISQSYQSAPNNGYKLTSNSLAMVDITNTTNDRIRIDSYVSNGTATLNGDNNNNSSYLMFLRIGDT
jgi:hypothetical protein